jgi:methyl-accepting chemotaxis protein
MCESEFGGKRLENLTITFVRNVAPHKDMMRATFPLTADLLTDVAGVAPEVAASVPEVAAIAPEVAAVAPEVAASAPEVAASAPEVAASAPEVEEPEAKKAKVVSQ